MIDGVVITLADISASRALEAELRKTQADMQERIAEQDAKLERAARGSADSADAKDSTA